MNKEFVGKRSMAYSLFRRDKRFVHTYWSDLDCLEVRGNNGTLHLVALKEVKIGFDSYPTEFQNRVFKFLAKKLNIPYYLVQLELDNPNGLKILRLRIMRGEQLITIGERGKVKVTVMPDKCMEMSPEKYIKWTNNL